MRWLKTTWILLVIGGCASGAPGTAPEAMSAEEHKAHARSHEQSAAGHEAEYDPEAEDRSPTSTLRSDFEFDVSTYNPTAGHKGQAEDERDVARQHAAAAAKLESYTGEQCAKFPPATRKECPLLTAVANVEDVPKGARLLLGPNVSGTALLEHLKCHHAFAGEQGYKDMPACPLYLKGVEVALAPDAKSVVITATDGAVVPELRRRARAHVSSASGPAPKSKAAAKAASGSKAAKPHVHQH